jgi:hypothetical protein
MHAKAFKKIIIHSKKTTTHSIITKTITKLSPRIPSGVAILSHPREWSAASRQSSVGFGSFVLIVDKGSRHLVLWSLGNLTGLSEILRQGTGCIKGRY